MNIIKGLPSRAATSDEMVAVDLEMFGQDKDKLHHPDQGTFASMQVAMGGDVYIITDKMDVPQMLDRIRPAKYWVFHNAQYDLRHLARFGKFKQRPVFDTYLYEKLMWAGYYSAFSLADLSRRYLGQYMAKDVREDFISATHMTDEMLTYAAIDADTTLKIAGIQQVLGATMSDTPAVYWEIEEPALWAILDFQPVKIDVEEWENLARVFTQKAADLEATLGVNVQSPQKVKEFLREQTGRSFESTGDDVIGPYAKEYPVIADILLARSYRVNKQTYGMKWLEKHLLPGDYIRSSFNQIGAETGRMTAQDPALYNLPARKFPEFRKTVISGNGNLVILDISQQEPRILAHLSGDKALIDIFREKKDVHLEVTRWIFADDTIQKSDPRRSEFGKPINLGTSYGLTAKGLSARTSLTEEEAQKFLDRYFSKFRGVKAYIELQHRIAVTRGYVETPFGRRIWINNYNYQAGNNAVNAPIQGGGSDQMKMWLGLIHKETRLRGIPYPVAINPYDEIVMDSSQELTEEYLDIALEALHETGKKLYPGIPFASTPAIGSNWGIKE